MMRHLLPIVLLAAACKQARYADTAAPATEVSTSPAEDTGGLDTNLECSTLNWDGWTDGFFATYCRACHSVTTVERYGAPEGVDFDTRANVLQWAERIRIRVLEEETMPLGGGVVRSDLEPLQRWLDCVGDNP